MPRSAHVFAAAVLLSLPLVRPASAEPPRFIVRAVIQAEELGHAEVKEMTSEVARIWDPYGVHIEWSPAKTTSPASLVVLVRFVDRIDAPGAPLGAVMRVKGRMQRLISVARATLDDQLRSARPDLARAFHGRLFGRLAGRVIAHELGHLLLDSASHSGEGLMRARFLRGDVMAGSGGAYALTAVERLRLEGRLTSVSAMTTTLALNTADEDWQ